MTDINSNIHLNIDTQEALANIKNLQRQISVFHQQMLKSGNAVNENISRNLQSTLMKNIDATGKFRTQIKTIQSETENFTENLEKNKFTIGQYFKYAGGASKSFGQLFKKEFATIEKVAIDRVKTIQTQYIKLGRDASGALKAIQVRPLALDMENLGTKAAIAAQKQQLLNQLLKQGSTAMLNWGKNTQWAGRQLMVGFTVPLTIMGQAAAKAYMDIEKAAISFRRVYGDLNTGAKETENMIRQIRGLAMEYTKYGIAVKDTMEMAAKAAATGSQGAELIAQVTQASKLAVLGQVDQQQALETTISLTNAFKTSTEDLAGSVNFLNAVENQTVTSIEDLTTAIPKAAPVVKQLGGDVKDLAFFLTAMKEGGINASEGANAIKSGLASMINPTKQATEFMSKFGVDVKGIVEGDKGNVKQMVIDMAKAFDTLDPLNRARGIEMMFGKFQFSRISTLFQNVVAEGSQASKVLELSRATTEELAVLSEREMKKVENSPAFKFQKAIEQIQAKLAPIGESFLKAITPVVEFVSKILDGFNNMSDGAKQFATMAGLVIAGIGPIALMTFGLVANGIANLIKMFAGLKNFFNRTKGDAAGLGDTTEYMTQKQLEAQSVAASLEESHAKLRQEFTLEAQAIQALVTEYERAIAAQAQYSAQASATGPAAAKATGVAKFASGGYIRGPGTSTSDSIPIMASNGEVILSADTVQANPEMVNALLAGKTTKKLVNGGFTGTGISATGVNDIQFKTQTDAAAIQKEMAVAAAAAETLGKDMPLILESMQRVLEVAQREAAKRGSAPTFGDYEASARQVDGGVIGFLGNNMVTTRDLEGKIVKGNEGVVQAHATPQKLVSREEANRWGNEQIAAGKDSATAREWAGATGDLKGYSQLVLGMPATSNKDMLTGKENADWIKGNGNIVTSNVAAQHGLAEDDMGLAAFRQKLEAKLREIGETVVDESMFAELVEQSLNETLDEAAANADIRAGANALDTSRNTLASYQTTEKGSKRKTVPQSVDASSILASDIEFGKGDRVIPGTERSMTLGGAKSYIDINEGDKNKRQKHDAGEAFMSGVIDDRLSTASAAGGQTDIDEAKYKAARETSREKLKSFKKGAGVNLGDGMAKGIDESTPESIQAVEKSTQSIIDKFKEKFKIHSPSEVTEGFGENLNEGLAQGLNNNWNEPVTAAEKNAQKISDAAKPKIPGVPDQTGPFGETDWNSPVPKKGAAAFAEKVKGAAADMTAKGLDVAGNITKKGFSKLGEGVKSGGRFVAEKAGTALQNYLEAGFKKAEAEHKLNIQRMEIARQALELTDDEYVANEQLLQAHQAKIAAGQAVTDAEIEAATQALQANRAKADVIATEMQNSQADLDAVQERIEIERQRQEVIAKEGVNNNAETGELSQRATTSELTAGMSAEQLAEQKATAKADQKAKYSKVSGKIGKYAMGATMVAGTLSMVGGPVGEMAQKVTPAIGAFSMLSQLIQGPVSAAFVGVVAIIGLIWMAVANLQAKFSEAQKATMEMKNATGVSTESIKKLGEFAGKVSASEFMSQYRQNRAKGVFAATGKKTFGESFVESDQGKALVEAYKKLKKSGGSKEVARDMAQQLSMAVVQGVLSDKQAKSIAANIGAELGDMTISARVKAQITELVGPNGENFTKDPVKVSAEFDKQAIDDLNGSVEMMNKNTDKVGTKVSTQVSQAGWMALSSGLGAAAVAGSIAATGAALGSVVPVIGTVVGALVGLGIAWAVTNGQAEEAAKKQGAMSGLVVANAVEALSMQKQQMDTLDAYYVKKIREAEQEGKITEAKRLQLQYDQQKNDLAAQQAQTTQTVLDAYSQIDDNAALAEGVASALDTKFKDDPNAKLVLPAIKQGLDNLDFGSDEKNRKIRGGLQIEMLTGNMDPGTLANIVSLMTSDSAVKDKFVNIYTKFGGQAASDVASLVSMYDNPELRMNILARMEATGSATERDALTSLLGEAETYRFVLNAEVDVIAQYYLDNDAAAAKQAALDDALQSEKVMTVEQAVRILPEFDDKVNKDLFDEAYFAKLQTSEEKEKYMKTISMIYNVDYKGNLKTNPEFLRWYHDEGQLKHGDLDASSDIQWQQWWAEAMGQKVTNEFIDQTNAQNASQQDTGTKTAPAAHWTDDVVKNLRDFVDMNQKLTVGINASLKALVKFKKVADTEFSGLATVLRKAGASEAMISNILADDAKNLSKFLKNGELTKKGLKVLADMYTAALGKYVESQRSSVQISNDQAAAIRKLTAAGMQYAVAAEVVKDAEVAQAIAHGATAKQIRALIKEQRTAAQTAWINMSDADRAGKYIDMYNANLEIIQAKEDEINKKYDKRNEALDKIQAANENIKRQNEAQLNLSEALSRGDLSAALKASDEAEALAAQQAVQARKDAMEQARKDELASIEVDINGVMMTREDIEKKIADQNIIIRDAKAAALESEIAIGEAAKANLAAAAEAEKKKTKTKTKTDKTDKTDGKSDGKLGGTKPHANDHVEGSSAGDGKIWKYNKTKDTWSAVESSDLNEGLPQDLKTGNAALRYKRSIMAPLTDSAMLKKGNDAYDRLAKANTAMAGVKGKAGNFKTKANLVKALQKNLITGAEYKAALPIVEEYEAARAEAYAYGVIKSNNEMTSIGGDLYNYNLQNDTTKTALAKAYGGYKEDVQTQYETLPASVQNVINWLKNRNTLYKAEIADLKTKRNKVKAISPAMLRSYDALSDAKKKKSEVKTLYIDNGVFTDADVKAYIKAEDLVETHAKKANAYRAQLISLGYNQTNMQPFLGNDKTALLTQMLPTNGDFSTIKRYATGGYVMPQKFVQGGYAVGTDTVPAMLTPGEFIVSQPAVKSFGTDNLKAINNGTYGGESVYNYSISVSVQSGADPDQIAQAVMTQIKQADSQRVRGNNF